MAASAFPSGAFRLAQVAPAPRWLPARGVHAFEVHLPTLDATGWALIDAGALAFGDEELRVWIVRQLNELVAQSSYGTACLELLHGYRVPSPPGPPGPPRVPSAR